MKKLMMVTALAVSLGAVASAQETKPFGLTIRAGIFWPTNNVGKKEGKTWFGGGVEYKLGDLKVANTGEKYAASYSVSVDYYSKGDVRHVPVLLNYTGHFDQSFYYVAGAGVGFVREKDSAGNKKNKTAFSYQVGLGYEFSKSQVPVFIEGKYVGSSKSVVNGFGVFLGVRF